MGEVPKMTPRPGIRRSRSGRRATLPAVPGTDPTPEADAAAARAAEAEERRQARNANGGAKRGGESENDARLRRDVPPHWG